MEKGRGAAVVSDDFIVYGNRVPRKGNAVFQNRQLPEGNIQFYAAGDNTVNNIDAYVYKKDTPRSRRRLDSRNSGQKLPKDMAAFTADPSKYYDFEINNENCRNPGAFILGFIVLKP